MHREPVISSSISSIGYDESTQTLEIEFSDGAIYQYLGVIPKIYKEIMDADSSGKYFHKNIKNIYNYSKVSG